MRELPTQSDILAGITTVCREHLGYQGALTPDTRLVDTLALDSVRMLTLVVELENRFALTLDEGDEAELVTVGDLAALLASRMGGSHG